MPLVLVLVHERDLGPVGRERRRAAVLDSVVPARRRDVRAGLHVPEARGGVEPGAVARRRDDEAAVRVDAAVGEHLAARELDRGGVVLEVVARAAEAERDVRDERRAVGARRVADVAAAFLHHRRRRGARLDLHDADRAGAAQDLRVVGLVVDRAAKAALRDVPALGDRPADRAVRDLGDLDLHGLFARRDGAHDGAPHRLRERDAAGARRPEEAFVVERRARDVDVGVARRVSAELHRRGQEAARPDGLVVRVEEGELRVGVAAALELRLRRGGYVARVVDEGAHPGVAGAARRDARAVAAGRLGGAVGGRGRVAVEGDVARERRVAARVVAGAEPLAAAGREESRRGERDHEKGRGFHERIMAVPERFRQLFRWRFTFSVGRRPAA